jgi:transposase
MAVGTRKKRERQQDLWIAANEIVQVAGNAFYDRLNGILDRHRFDRRVEHVCRKFYMIEGLDSERGIAWRTVDSLSLRKFLSYGLDEPTPDHSTISRTRRLYWLETHEAVFQWVIQVLIEQEHRAAGQRPGL